MGTSVYTSLLLKDYKRKAGEIKAMRKELRDLAKAVLARESDLRALEEVIRNRVPEFDPDNVKPVMTYPKVAGLKHGRLTTLILGCLREANGEPIPSNLITDYVLTMAGRDKANRVECVVMQRCVKDRLRKMAAKGQVIRLHDRQTSSFGLWLLPRDE